MESNGKKFIEPLTKDGKSAYEVIKEVGNDNLPSGVNLPTARSMTQARIDYQHRAQRIVDWYDKQSTLHSKHF